MSGLKFEGDESISEAQREFIKKVLEERGFTDNRVVFEDVGKAGDNYSSSVKRIIVKKEDGGCFKMIAKLALTIEMMREAARLDLLFRNETIIYEKILPKFVQLQKAAGVPPEEIIAYPKIYGSLEEPPNEVILLEDLKESGYVMLDRFKSLDNWQIKSILKNFAKLHGLSYVLKNKEPEVFEGYKNSLTDIWQEPEAHAFFSMFLTQIETSALMILEKDEHKRVIKGLIIGALDTFNKLRHADENAKQIVIQQGDAWTNNIMFDLSTGPIPKSIMIDYQQAKAANPVCDLLYMIFNCTDYKTRKEHYEEWIEYYHKQLDEVLSDFGLKANNIYPKDLLDADLKRYGKFGLILSIMLAGILISKPEDATKMRQAMESGEEEEMFKASNISSYGSDTVGLFKERIEGLINSFLEFGLI